MSDATAVILAAGKGTRMKSTLPKVLYPVLGRPMIHWVIDALEQSGVNRMLVVVGYEAEAVKLELKGRGGIEFATQSEQLGTGHAVSMCREQLEGTTSPVLVVAGDSPLLQSSSVTELLAAFRGGDYACLLGTLVKEDPTGLGRIVRDANGKFMRIVEHKDADEIVRQVREVNMSTYLFQPTDLLWALQHLRSDNSQGELYLTDCPEILLTSGRNVDALPVLKACESLSINTVDEVGLVESKMQEMGYRCGN